MENQMETTIMPRIRRMEHDMETIAVMGVI